MAAWAADMAARWTADGIGKWMARDRSDGSLVGRGGFTSFDLDGETVLELGWAVHDDRTGRGYATELGPAALAWAVAHQPDLPVAAFTEVHNRASLRQVEVPRPDSILSSTPIRRQLHQLGWGG